jgi:outer membrane immunogenic protein
MKSLMQAGVVIALGMAAGSAMAADLYAPVKAPLLVPVYSWTGCYIGAHAGGGVLREHLSATWSDGGIVGGQGGCNYQYDHLVVGIEGEGAWSSVGSTKDVSAGFFPGAPVTTTTFTSKWNADVGARFGLAYDRFLVYDKVGMAWTNQQFTNTISGPFGTNITGSATLPGVLWGLGLEYLITPNWTVKAETDFVFYRATDMNLTCSPIVFCGGGTSAVTSTNSIGIYAKMGFNYKFW